MSQKKSVITFPCHKSPPCRKCCEDTKTIVFYQCLNGKCGFLHQDRFLQETVEEKHNDLFDPSDPWIDVTSTLGSHGPIETAVDEKNKDPNHDLVYHCLQTDTERSDYIKLVEYINAHKDTFDDCLGYDFSKRVIIVYVCLDKSEMDRQQGEDDIRKLNLLTPYRVDKMQISQAF